MTTAHLSNNIDSFNLISVDDQLDGNTVTEILLCNHEYIIFISNGILRYNLKNVSNSAATKLNELSLLQSRAFRKFNHTCSDIVDTHVVAVLSEILGNDCSNEEVIVKIDNRIKNFHDYIEAEPAPNLVITSNKDYTIYLDNLCMARHQAREKSLQNTNILDDFYRIRAWGMAVLPEKKHRLLNLKLGTCLAAGFRAKLVDETSNTDNIFTPVVSFIEKNITDGARFYLTFYSIAFSIIVMTVSAISYYKFSTNLTVNLNILIMGIFGGVCGALISVLQRTKDLKVGLYEPTKMIVLQGVVRVGLGCAFGVISLVACKAGLLLDLMSENNSRLLTLAIIAGFSERLIPDFIEKTPASK